MTWQHSTAWEGCNGVGSGTCRGGCARPHQPCHIGTAGGNDVFCYGGNKRAGVCAVPLEVCSSISSGSGACHILVLRVSLSVSLHEGLLLLLGEGHQSNTSLTGLQGLLMRAPAHSRACSITSPAAGALHRALRCQLVGLQLHMQDGNGSREKWIRGCDRADPCLASSERGGRVQQLLSVQQVAVSGALFAAECQHRSLLMGLWFDYLLLWLFLVRVQDCV